MNTEHNFETVWKSILETQKLIHETKNLIETQSKETDKKFQEISLEMDKRSKETNRKFQEISKEFNNISKNGKKPIKKLKKEFNKIEEFYPSQWEKLVILVKRQITNLLKQRGIYVNHTSERMRTKYDNMFYEIDIVAENEKEILLITVRKTLNLEDLTDFLQMLEKAKKIFHKQIQNKIYGAVAYSKAKPEIEISAIQKGLLVIRATGNIANIINEENFLPKEF